MDSELTDWYHEYIGRLDLVKFNTDLAVAGNKDIEKNLEIVEESMGKVAFHLERTAYLLELYRTRMFGERHDEQTPV